MNLTLLQRQAGPLVASVNGTGLSGSCLRLLREVGAHNGALDGGHPTLKSCATGGGSGQA
jgi:hypothetical protein